METDLETPQAAADIEKFVKEASVNFDTSQESMPSQLSVENSFENTQQSVEEGNINSEPSENSEKNENRSDGDKLETESGVNAISDGDKPETESGVNAIANSDLEKKDETLPDVQSTEGSNEAQNVEEQTVKETDMESLFNEVQNESPQAVASSGSNPEEQKTTVIHITPEILSSLKNDVCDKSEAEVNPIAALQKSVSGISTSNLNDKATLNLLTPIITETTAEVDKIPELSPNPITCTVQNTLKNSSQNCNETKSSEQLLKFMPNLTCEVIKASSNTPGMSNSVAETLSALKTLSESAKSSVIIIPPSKTNNNEETLMECDIHNVKHMDPQKSIGEANSFEKDPLDDPLEEKDPIMNETHDNSEGKNCESGDAIIDINTKKSNDPPINCDSSSTKYSKSDFDTELDRTTEAIPKPQSKEVTITRVPVGETPSGETHSDNLCPTQAVASTAATSSTTTSISTATSTSKLAIIPSIISGSARSGVTITPTSAPPHTVSAIATAIMTPAVGPVSSPLLNSLSAGRSSTTSPSSCAISIKSFANMQSHLIPSRPSQSPIPSQMPGKIINTLLF